MATLIDNSRAILDETLLALNSSNPSLLAKLLLAASAQIRRECRRDFESQSYSEFYSGSGMPYQVLILKQFPVTAIGRVASYPQEVLDIQNTARTTNQRATAAVTSTGIVLTRVASGVTSTSTLLFATYPTIALLAAAVTALGSGWSGLAAGGYENWPSVDLRPIQGAFNALSGARLEAYTEDLQVNWRLREFEGILEGYFPPGRLNIRVDYTAGYSTIPEDIQEGCVQLVKDLYQDSLHDMALQSSTLGPYSKTMAAGGGAGLSKKVMSKIASYVAHDRIITAD